MKVTGNKDVLKNEKSLGTELPLKTKVPRNINAALKTEKHLEKNWLTDVIYT